MWYFFMKAGHSSMVLLGRRWGGDYKWYAANALMEFQRSGAYENQEMEADLKI